MWEFVLTYDHVISAACDIFCTCVMVVNILKNRKRIDKLEEEVCPVTGKEKEPK
jgi:hypothetical protein